MAELLHAPTVFYSSDLKCHLTGSPVDALFRLGYKSLVSKIMKNDFQILLSILREGKSEAWFYS